MKRFYFACITFLLAVSVIWIFVNKIQRKGEIKNVNQLWYSDVISQITKQEYNIVFQEKVSALQSPNRMHNLRITYTSSGVRISPRLRSSSPEARSLPSGPGRACKEQLFRNIKINRDADDWRIEMKLDGYGKGLPENKFQGKQITAAGNKAFIEDKKIRIEYENSQSGMRQNFVIKEKPAAKGILKIAVKVGGDLDFKISRDKISFVDSNGKEKLRYCGLNVFDSKGKTLPAFFERSAERKFLIAVNDEGADYPVTIDPVTISPDWMARGGQKEAYFAQRLASAGDVNGDGYADVIIGANSYDNGQTDEGKAYLYYGAASGLSAVPAWTAEGNQEGALFGHVVASAGDVNNDGYSDVIVASPGYSNGQSGEGRVFVYYGSANGLPATANWTGESDKADAYYGNSAASAGDVNKDGYSDIIIGAPYYSSSLFKPQTGRVYVYYGSASGLSGTASWTKDGASAYNMLGFSASAAGDVNKDGCSDVIVSAPGYGSGQTYEGIAYLYLGKSTGLQTTAAWNYESNRDTIGFGFCVSPAGDINNDGYADVIVGVPDYSNGQAGEGAAYIFCGQSSGLSSAPNWFKESNIEKSSFGYSVASAGDVNHDGYNDILIGSPNYANGNIVEGAAYLFYGTASGLSSTAGWMVESNQDSASLGYCVASAGDINKDGIKDILIGAPAYNGGTAREGEAFVYYGSNNGPLPVELLSFSAELRGRDVVLKWVTATEVNNFGFEIERCRLNSENLDYQTATGADIRDWKKIGFVRGAGNSNSQKSYNFTDTWPEAGRYLYRLKQIDDDGKIEYPADLQISVNEDRGFELQQNNPNPCNPSARIEYSIPEKAQVTLKLYNAAGQEVAVLVNEEKSPGHYQYYFNGSRLPSGLYIYSLQAGKYSAAKKMIIIK